MMKVYTTSVFRDNLSYESIFAALLLENDAKGKVNHFIFLKKFAVHMKSIQPTFIDAGISKKNMACFKRMRVQSLTVS